jgi:Flp pilus assembly pilin Flp
MAKLASFLRDERGASAAEFALLLAAIMAAGATALVIWQSATAPS